MRMWKNHKRKTAAAIVKAVLSAGPPSPNMSTDPCAATLRLTADLTSGSPLAEALLRPPRRESQLTLLQLDRSQFLPLAALQLLRHTASGGASCGALRLLHEHDSPELRLDLTGQSEPGVLALPCVPQAHGNTDSGLVWLERHLDYRCHVPQQPGTARLPAPLRRCLQSLARSGPGSRVVVDALGADDASRGAVARRAAALLSPGGIETAVLALSGAGNQVLPPPCCSLEACATAAAPNASRGALEPRRAGIFAPPPGLPLLAPPAAGAHASRPAGVPCSVPCSVLCSAPCSVPCRLLCACVRAACAPAVCVCSAQLWPDLADD